MSLSGIESPHSLLMKANSRQLTWSGRHDLVEISRNCSLPILVRALEGNYGNSEIDTFSRLDVIKIHKVVVIDLVVATFQTCDAGVGTSGGACRYAACTHNHDFAGAVDMMQDRPLQICFPKHFHGLFQVNELSF